MNPAVSEALALYGLADAKAAPLRHNENELYRIDLPGKAFALRIHKSAPGFTAPDYVPQGVAAREGELALLLALGERGMAVQRPVRDMHDRLVPTLKDGTPVSLLEWACGETLEALYPNGLPEKAAFAVGEAAGRLFALQKEKPLPGDLLRPRYGPGMLAGIEEAIRRAREADALTKDAFEAIRRCLAACDPLLREAECRFGVSICHSDLSPGNMVYENGQITLIDFSLCGYASPLMDLGSLFANFTRAGEQPALLAGWEQASGLNSARRNTDGMYPGGISAGKNAAVALAEPYFAMGILLFIAARYENAPAWDWFPAAVERWTNTVFKPLARGERFLAAE